MLTDQKNTVLQKLSTMSQRIPYNPFEELDDFPDLKSLMSHILKSLEVTTIKVVLPGIFDTTLIHDPQKILPVYNILIGDATFNYIRYRVEYVLSSIKDRIEKINQNSQLSFTDKLRIFEEVKNWIQKEYKYFNSMNAIRYMSSYQWMISYTEEVDGTAVQKEMNYPNSKIDLRNKHWNIIENSFIIRRDLLSEIHYLVDEEIDKLEEELTETKYGWKSEVWEYQLNEIALSILVSGQLEIIKGTERTFVHDFLAFFSKTDKDFSYYKGKILDRSLPRGKYQTRGRRSNFLNTLQESLENYRVPTEEKKLI